MTAPFIGPLGPLLLCILFVLVPTVSAAYVGDGGEYAAMIYVIALIIGLIVAVIIIFIMYFMCFRPYLNREKEKSLRGSSARISYHSQTPQRGSVNLRPDAGMAFNSIGAYGNKRNSDPVVLGVDNYNNEPYRSSLPAINQQPPRYDTPSNQLGTQMGISQVTRQIAQNGQQQPQMSQYQTAPMQPRLQGYNAVVADAYQQEPYGNRNSQLNYSREGTVTPSGSMGDAAAQNQVLVQDQYMNQAGRAAQSTTTYRTTTTTTKQAVLASNAAAGAFTGSSV